MKMYNPLLTSTLLFVKKVFAGLYAVTITLHAEVGDTAWLCPKS